MRTRTKQSGFGIVQALIIVVIIVAIGAGGWFVYQHNRTQSTDAAGNPTGQQTNNTPTQSVSYLTITEWGVKLPLTSGIKDAYYTVGTGSVDQNGQPNTMWLGLRSLDGDCDATKANQAGATTISAIGSFDRALPTDTDPISGTLYTKLYPGKTIGNYYYFYMTNSKSKTCTSTNGLQSIDAAFATAAQNTTTPTN